MAVATLMCMASCSQEEIVKQNAAKPGDLIQFSIGQRSTRTAYEAEAGHGESWQIDWLTGDKVTVFCDEAETVKEADYEVLPTGSTHNPESPEEQSKYGVLKVNENGLVWSGANNENTEHNFYAVYPAGAATFDNGIMKFNINNEQTCTTDGTFTDGVCTTTCDMTNANMVAYAQATPKSVEAKPLSLEFDPIMTTLEITINGYAHENTGSPIKVQGVAITLDNVPVTSDGSFLYDVDNFAIVEEGATKQTETFFINIDNNGEESVTLNGTDKLVVTAFLPPVGIMSDPDNPTDPAKNTHLTVRVMAEGSVDYSFTLKNGVNASDKKKLLLPYMTTDKMNGNNWITPLPDDIYISQLSIPGTISSLSAGSYEGLATAQGKTLVEQWADGVRAFEFRSSMSSILSGDAGVNLYDGGVNLNNGDAAQYSNFRGSVEALYGLLTGASKNEFAILINSYQAEQYSGWQGAVNKWYKKTWVNIMYQQMNGRAAGFLVSRIDPLYTAAHFIGWRPDLTVGEARGKIILINMDAYGPEDDYGDNDIYYNGNTNYNSALVLNAMSIDRKTTSALLNYSRDGRDYNTAGTWHDVAYGGTSTKSGSSIASNGIYIQNLFGQYPTRETADLPESSQVKYSEKNKETAVLDADAIAQSLTEEANKNKWVINSIGGANATTTDEYKKAAAHINQYYKSNVLNNASRPKAPTGIVLVAHQGLDEYEESLVYGLTMPQMIINNNYKYRAQRKPAQ